MGNILILGGTHGNEREGIEIVKSLAMDNVETHITNPLAVEHNVRFIDEDINTLRAESYINTHERRIYESMIQDFRHKYDYVIDIHSTDSTGMGMSIIFSEISQEVQKLLCSVQEFMPDTEFIRIPDRQKLFLENALPRNFGISLEVESTPHGNLSMDALTATQSLVRFIIESLPANAEVNTHAVEYFEIVGSSSVRAKNLTNYKLVEEGELISDGISSTKPFYPLFIDETAYLQRGVSFKISEKKVMV